MDKHRELHLSNGVLLIQDFYEYDGDIKEDHCEISLQEIFKYIGIVVKDNEMVIKLVLNIIEDYIRNPEG